MVKTTQTVDNIAEEIKQELVIWKLEEKSYQYYVSNMIKTYQILKVHHHPHFAYTINLVVRDALKSKEILSVLTKCKDLVKSNNVVTQKLIMEQKIDIITPLKLV